VREWDKAQAEIDEGRDAATAVDAAAHAADLDECGSATWVGNWFDEAQRYHDDQVAATKPTGDFMTDVEAACNRLADDIADSPFPFTPVDTQLWAFSIKDGLNLFQRDIERLDIPEEHQHDVDLLDAAIVDLNDSLQRVITAVVNGSKDPDALVADVQADIAAVLERIDALGVSC
jgi:hypothetical protein